ncbi:hypothetical protein ACEUZ9_004340 [Paracoccus litorisediminis]|nr:hypothetical protein [Paracoccus litorisediminis]
MHKVILFSGHMTDGPGRAQPRFPADKEGPISAAIHDALSGWQVRAGDIGICGAARGGDILFAEHCLTLGATVHLFLPLPEDAFLESSVSLPRAIDLDWEQRFRNLCAASVVHWPTSARDPAEPTEQPFVRNNAIMLAYARESAPIAPHVLLLWDGKSPDGNGGTAEIARATRHVAHRIIIDPADF